MKRALITGLTGQDGSYLAEFLLDKGYEVHGILRRASTSSMARVEHLQDRLTLHHADLLDLSSLIHVIQKVEADEIYNLAAQSFVPTSFEQALLTSEVTALGACRLLEAIRLINPKIRFYQASSSEMFGKVEGDFQDEDTKFHPRSPYAVSKVYAHHMTVNYRESYGLHASSGILFNHESERRGIEFVTRKISSHVAMIKHGFKETLKLGNLEARRDWGFAGDYVKVMWAMLQEERPDDYVIATGVTHSVQDFCERAFAHVDLDWQDFVEVDERFQRVAEVEYLCGNTAKAKEKLGWSPELDFSQLVARMVESDLERVRKSSSGMHRRNFWYEQLV
ncbi:MAG: GDP-mannose 4,6-dehydratase [Planctomycetota bacterium]|nr:GDP-mannose 4,6-dehydratase [Planctomycetota bacterium]